MRATRSLGVQVLFVVLLGHTCSAQSPPIRRLSWDGQFADAVYRVDRRVLREAGSRYRPLVDNADRVHLSLRYMADGSRLVQVATPAAWGEDKAVGCATECAGVLGWPIADRYVCPSGASLIVGIMAPRREGRSWRETVPWPGLVAVLERAGASQVELRLRASGMPLSSQVRMTGWDDAGNAATEIRVRLCAASSPPAAMDLVLGFSPEFIRAALLTGLLALLGAFGTILAVYRSASRGRRPVATQVRFVRWTTHVASVGWLAAAVGGGVTFLPVLLRVSGGAGMAIRVGIVFGPAVAFYVLLAVLSSRLRRSAPQQEMAPRVLSGPLLALLILPGVALGIYLAASGASHTGPILRNVDRTVRWLPFVLLGLVAMQLALFRMLRGRSRTVATGDLWHRCRDLAAASGVSLGTVRIVDGRMLRSNGSAGAGGSLALTRQAVELLPRAEIDALVAHELGHMKLHHVEMRARAIVGLCLPFAAPAAWGMLTGQWILAGLVVLAGPIAFALASPLMRKQELAADALGAEMLGDPRAMMRMLAHVSCLNRIKADRPRWVQAISTHPATERRVHALAARFAVPQDEADAILRQYQQPPAAACLVPPADRYHVEA